MKRFQKQRKENIRIHPGEMFRQSWNEQIIEKELKRAQRDEDLPRFDLDKVEIHPSKSCNLTCAWCYGRNVVPPINERRDLPATVIRDILKDIREEMPKQDPLIIYAGLYSEPLMNRAFSSIMDITGKECFRFGIYTNGLLMNPELADVVAQSAKNTRDSRPSYITFNLSSSFDSKKKNVLENILNVIKETDKSRKKNNSPLLLNGSLLAYHQDISKYKEILEETKKRGIDNIRFSFPWNAQKNESNHDFGGLTGNEYKRFSEEFLKLKETYPDLVSIRFPPMKLFDHCFVGTQALSISSEGDVFPCPEVSSLLFKKTHSYGNIYDEKISRIWHSDSHKEMFLKLDPYMVEKKCVCCYMDEEINRHCSKYWIKRE